LRLDHHWRRRVERTQFVDREQNQRDPGRVARAAPRQHAGDEPGADRLDCHQGHHVADAERVAVEECDPRDRRHREQGNDD